MELVQSYHQLNSFISEIRSLRKGFISNLFLHFEKHNLWIEKKELFYQATTEGYFIFRNNSMVSYLFYITTDEFQLRKGLQEITPQIKKTVMVDILEDSKIESIKQVFFDNDFLLYEELNRMSRIGLPDSIQPGLGVTFAEPEDSVVILQLLYSNFDPLSEQIPDIEEIAHYIQNKWVLVYKLEHKIVGFIIFELTGLTLYLRYWFVLPQFREMNIGSKLFNSFMYEGRNTKRQLLWVITHNINAIKRYVHYGFKPVKWLFPTLNYYSVTPFFFSKASILSMVLKFSGKISMPSITILNSVSRASTRHTTSNESSMPSSMKLRLSSVKSNSGRRSLKIAIIFSFIFILVLIRNQIIFLVCK